MRPRPPELTEVLRHDHRETDHNDKQKNLKNRVHAVRREVAPKRREDPCRLTEYPIIGPDPGIGSTKYICNPPCLDLERQPHAVSCECNRGKPHPPPSIGRDEEKKGESEAEGECDVLDGKRAAGSLQEQGLEPGLEIPLPEGEPDVELKIRGEDHLRQKRYPPPISQRPPSRESVKVRAKGVIVKFEACGSPIAGRGRIRLLRRAW